MRTIAALLAGLAIGLVTPAACVVKRAPACQTQTACDSCVAIDGCAWCFETNDCSSVDATCPGDRALTNDQCTAEPADGPDATAP